MTSEQPPQSQHRFIVLEGPIGVGKTTLATKLAETLGAELVLERADANPFLERFYRNPRAGALAAQLVSLARELAALPVDVIVAFQTPVVAAATMPLATWLSRSMHWQACCRSSALVPWKPWRWSSEY